MNKFKEGTQDSSFYTSINKMGNFIFYRGYDEKNNPVLERVKFRPTLYSPNPTGKYSSLLSQEKVSPIKLKSMSEAFNYVKSHPGTHGNKNYIAQFIYEKFPQEEIKYSRGKINVTTIDIEVISDEGFPFPEQADHPIVLITTRSNIDKVFHIFGMGDFDNKCPEDTVYHKCSDEVNLLYKFVNHWSSNFPDVITGWNSKFFDIPYIVNRIKKIMGKDEANILSPFGIIKERTLRAGAFGGQERQAYDFFGISQLDYMDIFKKFAYSFGPQESYSLEHISSVVLGKGKISYQEYNTLQNLYRENFQLFVEYNKVDVDLVDQLEEKINLITLVMDIAYKAGTNYVDTFGTTNIWETIIFRKLKPLGIVLPPRTNSIPEKFLGGYVKEPQLGMHNWVTSFDLNNLYPNIMIQYNMSPETLIGVTGNINIERCLEETKLVKKSLSKDSSMAANGAHFRTDKMGVLPTILIDYYAERKEVKKKMIEAKKKQELLISKKANEKEMKEIQREIATLENKQWTIKILLNSVFGALGNQYFLLYNIDIAKAITYSGQFVIRRAEKIANKLTNEMMDSKEEKDYIIAMDTDSLYVNFGPLVQKYMGNRTKEQITKKLSKLGKMVFVPTFERDYREMFKMYGGILPRMEMAREVIANKGVWIAKKKYFLNVFNNEGIQYDKPKIKIVGVEAVKSSTPAPCRKELESIFDTIMNSTEKECQKSILKFKEEFFKMDPHEIAFPRGVNGIEKYSSKKYPYYSKGCPINVRASINFNKMIKAAKLINYSPIKSGDKIKYLFLKEQNPTRENVMGFPQYLPEELDLKKYIDYEKQFQKSYVAPLELIFKIIKWDIEKQSKLDNFFI